MALRLSTGLRNFLNENESLKQALHDGVIRIYSGTQPATADDAVVGTLLVSITYNGAAFTEGAGSTAQQDKVTLTYGSDGNTYALVINSRSYTYVTQAGDTAATTATKLAAKVHGDKDVYATADGNVIFLRAAYPGQTVTVANTGSTTPANVVIANTVANARINGVQFGTSAAGVLSKETGNWSGVAVATGTAGWFRFQGNATDDDLSSTTLARMDGNVGTSGANLNMSSTAITSGATTTIDTFTLTLPAS